MENIYEFVKNKVLNLKRKVSRYAKIKKCRYILIQQNPKFICLYNLYVNLHVNVTHMLTKVHVIFSA